MHTLKYYKIPNIETHDSLLLSSGYLTSQSGTTTFCSNMESSVDLGGEQHSSSSDPFKWMVEFEEDEVTGKMKKKKKPTTPPPQEEHIKMVFIFNSVVS